MPAPLLIGVTRRRLPGLFSRSLFPRRPSFLLNASLLTLTTLLVSALSTPHASAQPQPRNDDQPRLNGSAGVSGLGVVQNNRWGTVQAQVANPTDAEQTVRIHFRFLDQPSHQFARQIVLPPKTTRQEQIGVRLSGVPGGSRSAENETVMLTADGAKELARQTGNSPFVDDPNLFLVISDDRNEDFEAARTLEAVREGSGLPKRMAYAGMSQLMRFEVGWDGVRAAAILTDDSPFDGAQTRAMRRWLYAGGTLIVFADQVGSEPMQRVLGDDWSVQYIDHLTLTTLPFTDATGRGVATVTTEKPIAMTRLVAPQYTTHLSVAGWPALLSRELGHGRVVVVTVGGSAWIDPSGKEALREMIDQLLPTANMMVTKRTTDATRLLDEEAGAAFVRDQIGVRVLGRGPVGAMLGAMALALAVAGWIVARKGRGEWLGPVGVGGAVVTAIGLIVAGAAARGQKEPTASSLHLVRAVPGQTTARADSITAVYEPVTTDLDFAGHGGWAWPSAVETAGKTYRLFWRDLDAWQWPGIEAPANTAKTVRAQLPLQLTKPIALDLRFTPDGLVGSLDRGDVAPLSDLVVITPQATLAVALDDSAALSLGDAPLPEGVYFSGNVLGAAQQERKRLLDLLLARTRFDRPTLLAWSDRAPATLHVEPEPARQDHALFQIPLVVRDARPGDRVRVPWPLMEMVPAEIGDDRMGLTTLPIYQPHEKTFIGVSGASAFIAEFVVPREVLPLRIDGARVHLNITAIGRPVRVLSVRDGKLHELGGKIGPDGDVVIEADAEHLQIDRRGRVRLAFDVGPIGGGGERQVAVSDLWRVRHFGLELTGTVLDHGSEHADQPATDPAPAAAE